MHLITYWDPWAQNSWVKRHKIETDLPGPEIKAPFCKWDSVSQPFSFFSEPWFPYLCNKLLASTSEVLWGLNKTTHLEYLFMWGRACLSPLEQTPPNLPLSTSRSLVHSFTHSSSYWEPISPSHCSGSWGCNMKTRSLTAENAQVQLRHRHVMGFWTQFYRVCRGFPTPPSNSLDSSREPKNATQFWHYLPGDSIRFHR